MEKQNIQFKSSVSLETPNKMTFVCALKPESEKFGCWRTLADSSMKGLARTGHPEGGPNTGKHSGGGEPV